MRDDSPELVLAAGVVGAATAPGAQGEIPALAVREDPRGVMAARLVDPELGAKLPVNIQSAALLRGDMDEGQMVGVVPQVRLRVAMVPHQGVLGGRRAVVGVDVLPPARPRHVVERNAPDSVVGDDREVRERLHEQNRGTSIVLSLEPSEHGHGDGVRRFDAPREKVRALRAPGFRMTRLEGDRRADEFRIVARRRLYRQHADVLSAPMIPFDRLPAVGVHARGQRRDVEGETVQQIVGVGWPRGAFRRLPTPRWPIPVVIAPLPRTLVHEVNEAIAVSSADRPPPLRVGGVDPYLAHVRESAIAVLEDEGAIGRGLSLRRGRRLGLFPQRIHELEVCPHALTLLLRILQRLLLGALHEVRGCDELLRESGRRVRPEVPGE
mmetsp:Transcript_45047/g.131170  ORF Transcript_45047/g.131170 Transcript_45047/m.131170 type:complete len:381 (+) Transcript_45047:2225-3367(+)